MQALTNGVNNLLQYLPEAPNLDQYPTLQKICRAAATGFYILAEFVPKVYLVLFCLELTCTHVLTYLPPLLAIIGFVISLIAISALLLDFYIPGTENHLLALFFRPHIFPIIFYTKLWIYQCLGLDINTWKDPNNGLPPVLMPIPTYFKTKDWAWTPFEKLSELTTLSGDTLLDQPHLGGATISLLAQSALISNQALFNRLVELDNTNINFTFGPEGYGYSALYIAAVNNEVAPVKTLLKQENIAINHIFTRDPQRIWGYTTLSRAAIHGCFDTFKAISDHPNAEINQILNHENLLQTIVSATTPTNTLSTQGLNTRRLQCFKALLADDRINPNNNRDTSLLQTIIQRPERYPDYLPPVLESQQFDIHAKVFTISTLGIPSQTDAIGYMVHNLYCIPPSETKPSYLTEHRKVGFTLLAKHGAIFAIDELPELQRTMQEIFRKKNGLFIDILNAYNQGKDNHNRPVMDAVITALYQAIWQSSIISLVGGYIYGDIDKEYFGITD